MITRRQAIQLATLPLIVTLPLLEGDAKAEAVEPIPQKGMSRQEMITYYYAMDHHDPIQLGLVDDLPKSVSGSLRFADYIFETSERNNVPMPARFHAMVERLKKVQETGKPVSQYSDISFSNEDDQKADPEIVSCWLVIEGKPDQQMSCERYQKGYYYVRYPEGVELTLKWRFNETPGGREHTVVRNYSRKV